MRLLVALSVFLLAVSAAADPAAAFRETCAGCHTIGGGDLTGPDLNAATQWPRADVRAAVERMQDYTGTLTPQQIDALADFLKDPNVKTRLAAPPKPAFDASPATGRKLFFGEQKLANGGMPCFACHSAGGRGGSLAADLTLVHQRMGETPLLAATEKPNFPLMKTSYGARPVTAQEAHHLAAFFAEAAKEKPR